MTGRVDVHAHYIPPGYREALTAAGVATIGGIPVPQWSPDAAIEFMDRYGIAVQMLSLSDPGVDFLDAGDAAALAQRCNDDLAELIDSYPQRFGGFAAVSLQDVSAARAEAARAFDSLGLDGVGLLSNSEGRYLGDPAFDALLADLDARSAWVFVHPRKASGVDAPAYQVPDFVAEYPFDTTRTIISLLVNDAFGKHPNIRWHFAHGGGTLPMLRARLAIASRFAAGLGPMLGLPKDAANLTEEKTLAYLARNRYDTALVGDVPALLAVAGISQVRNVHFGSDWPFAQLAYQGSGDPTPALGEAFTDEQRRHIERLNGRREFSRLSFLTND